MFPPFVVIVVWPGGGNGQGAGLATSTVPSLPALGPWAPPAERGPSLESIYWVSLAVDLCEGQGRKLAAFIATLSATIPAQHRNSPLL